MSLKILFLCTGNSARSQMAEGLARHLGKGAFDVRSAGLMPKGIHPLAISVMDEIGINIRSQRSKTIDSALLGQVDIVITLCDHADARCPILPPHIRKEHWPLLDPTETSGSEAEKRKIFQNIRDAIKEQILHFLEKKTATYKKG